GNTPSSYRHTPLKLQLLILLQSIISAFSKLGSIECNLSSELIALLLRKFHKIFTFYRTAIVVFLGTFIALNKQDMTGIIYTIDMFIAWFPTLMATSYHLPGNSFAKSFIEDKILSYEFVF